MHSPNTLHGLFVLAAIVVVAVAAPAGSESGACCVFSESCLDDVDPGTCAEVFGGTYQGDGSTCTDDHDCPSATGACCFGPVWGAWCEEGTAFECALYGGVYQGDESTCETVDCPTGLCPGHGDCCTVNRSPGCENEICCGIVCELDPYCCTEAWDSVCVAEAEEFCGCGLPKGDIDADGYVDLADFAWWPECMTGPDHGPYDAPCIAFDFDKDGDVDLRDFAAFQRAFLPLAPPAPDCGNGTKNADEQCDGADDEACPAQCRTNCTCPECGDGITDPDERCDDGGESAACDPDCTFAECGDDTLNTTAGEQCDDGNVVPGDGCDADCQSELCGNGTLDPGEECDDGNTVSGDGCDANCRNEVDSCADATAVAGEGPFGFDNTSATLDGPPHASCLYADENQIDNDVWMCWTSPCTATVFVDTCQQTSIDTKIAVYEGCDCPATDERLASCNDDGCDLQSVVAFEAVSGQSYLIRMGTFPGAPGGAGTMSIRCGAANCPGIGDCFSANGVPGCDDEGLCELTCPVDPYCCYVEWDEVCACEASGLFTGSFDACAAGSGDCSTANGTGGCDDVACCNTVCAADPFCCCDTWDTICADEAADMCGP